VSSTAAPPTPYPTPDPPAAGEVFAAIERAVASVVLAEPLTVRLAVGCLAAGGHLLVEDHPGLGKTTLAKSLAGAVGLGFRRLQCTADLLPADVTGATILGPDGTEPRFRPGPVFTHLLMADELNRASPRAQSALLEAMEERQVTVDGTT
jgi:MoxR-like ATPase